MFLIFCFKLPLECKSKDHQDQASVCTSASSFWNFPSAHRMVKITYIQKGGCISNQTEKQVRDQYNTFEKKLWKN